MKVALSFLGAAVLAIGVAATSAEARKSSDKAEERLSDFKRTGEYTNCLNLRSISQIKALDDKHFLVRVGVNKYYLNKPSSRCNGASRSFNHLQYKTSLSQLCSNEIIKVVDSNGFISGSCGLRKFERLEPKAPEGEDDSA